MNLRSGFSNLFRCRLVLGAGLVLLSTSAGATESYQVSGEASFYTSNGDRRTIDYDRLQIGLEYYLRPVSFGDYPYAEAVFFDRQSSVRIAGGYDEAKSSSLKVNGPTFRAGATYSNAETPFVVDFDYTTSSVRSIYGEGVDSQVYSLRAGYYLAQPAMAWLLFERERTQSRAGGVNSDLPDLDRVGAGAKVVTTLEHDRAVNLELELSREAGTGSNQEDLYQNIFEAGLDYYFNRAVSVGAAFAHNWGDDTAREGNTYLLRTDLFLSEKAHVGLSLIEVDAARSGYNRSAVELFLQLRY